MFGFLKKIRSFKKKTENIRGLNNEIIYITDKGCFPVANIGSSVNIQGNNNKIALYSEDNQIIKQFPRGLSIRIKGDNNVIKISMPTKFSSVLIGMNSNNTISIKRQPQGIGSAKFFIEDGSDAYIGEDCQLDNGNLYVVVNNSWPKRNKLIIGDGVYIAKDCIIRTSDGHTIINIDTNEAINPPCDVVIENNVWITSRCTILKGSYISENSIVAAGSVVTGSFHEKNIIIGGVPAKIIKHNVRWDRRHFNIYKQQVGI